MLFQRSSRSWNIAALQDNCIGTKLNNGYIISAGFFLEFKGFYETLSDMDEEQRKLIHMNSVANVNQLYGNEQLCRAQRKDARYINIGMYLTLLGGVASDQLEDGRIVSGVGGQFNFVEQGIELEDGRSILVSKALKGVEKT